MALVEANEVPQSDIPGEEVTANFSAVSVRNVLFARNFLHVRGSLALCGSHLPALRQYSAHRSRPL